MSGLVADAGHDRLLDRHRRAIEVLPRVRFYLREPLRHVADVEMIEADVAREFVPGDRRGYRSVGARACRIRRDRGRAFGVAQIIDEDLAAARHLEQLRSEAIGEGSLEKLRDRLRE